MNWFVRLHSALHGHWDFQFCLFTYTWVCNETSRGKLNIAQCCLWYHPDITILHHLQTQGASITQPCQREIMGRAPFITAVLVQSRPFRVGFVVDKLTLGQVSPWVLPLSPVSINLSVFGTHSFIIEIGSVCNWPTSKPGTSAFILNSINWVVFVMEALHFLWGRDQV
jgi:hypothetical protein